MTKKDVREVAMYILGGIIVVSVIVFLVMLALHPMPVENKDALMMALGALLAAFTGVVGYFYGSSKGSADKTEAMAAQPPKDGANG